MSFDGKPVATYTPTNYKGISHKDLIWLRDEMNMHMELNPPLTKDGGDAEDLFFGTLQEYEDDIREEDAFDDKAWTMFSILGIGPRQEEFKDVKPTTGKKEAEKVSTKKIPVKKAPVKAEKEAEAQAPVKAEKEAVKKAPVKKEATKKEVVKVNTGAGRTKFGSRIGSQAGRIDEMLIAKEPESAIIKMLCKEFGCEPNTAKSKIKSQITHTIIKRGFKVKLITDDVPAPAEAEKKAVKKKAPVQAKKKAPVKKQAAVSAKKKAPVKKKK